jgi:flagellar hook-associated protein 2
MALGTIQTGIGLISGMDIGGTVDKLMALAAKPRDMLQTNTNAIKTQQTALTTIAALLYAIKVPSDNLGKSIIYQQRTATSSNPNALAVTVTGNPALGSYEYTPLRLAQSQKLLSSGFASDTAALGAGSFTIRFGDRVDRNAALNILGKGQGFVRGKMRITDGLGESADIDLSTAQTVDDVLNAINSNGGVNVTATAVNGHIHLVDNTGGTSNLRVQDIGTGKTAASLGLAGINSSTGSADGQDLLSLYGNISLNALNDGMGVEVSPTLPDIKYTLLDGTSGEIDFAPGTNTTTGNPESTLQQLIDEVSTQSGGKLKLEIAADGKSLQLTDTTSGSGSFTLQSEYGSQALHDLGLDAGTVGGVVTVAGNVAAGARILGGLTTVSLGSLNGGKGLGALGGITLTDRYGFSDTINLQNAQTLDDVIGEINASNTVHIHAQVNKAGNGIELIDTTGGSTGSMSVTDADATNTATKLHLNTASGSAQLSSVNSGDLHLKVIGENTLLSSLNGGAGVANGKFTISDGNGAKPATIDLTKGTIKTIGDVIRAINQKMLSVQASLNATGDGILLKDTGGGALTVQDSGSTTARDLGLARTSTRNTDGSQQIDGSLTYKIDILNKDALQNVNAQINQLNAGFSSSIITDGSAQPYHLAITSGHTGKAGAMVIDTSGVNFSFAETAKAQDSLLLLGPQSAEATAVLTSSSTNTYTNLVDGLKLTLQQATGQTVNVNVNAVNTNLSASVKVFVDNYNKYWDELTKDTAYDTANNKPATLTGDSTTFSFENEMSNLVSGKILGAGKLTSLAEIGITFSTDGHLQYDDTVLQHAVDSDPQAVKDFFTTKDTGFSGKVGALIEQLAGADKSMLSHRLDGLQAMIDDNNKRIDVWNTRLNVQKDSMLMQFYNMELAIGNSQSNLKTLDSIAWMTNGNLFNFSNNNNNSSG